MDVVKIFSSFEAECELIQSKREAMRILCAITPSFNRFVKREFNVFIVTHATSLEDCRSCTLLVEEPLNERISRQIFRRLTLHQLLN
jgi:hypothetical protein